MQGGACRAKAEHAPPCFVVPLDLPELPWSNLFCGGHDIHGRFGFLSIFSLERFVQVILKIEDPGTLCGGVSA